MRKLNAKQRKFLDTWFEKHKGNLQYSNTIYTLTGDEYEKLIELNEFETFNAYVERYINDKISEEKRT